MDSLFKKLRDPYVLLTFFLLLGAFLLRLYHLELRMVHHDEGVNGWFIDNLLSQGKYKYSPEHYHGPTLFYLGYLFAKIFGLNTFSLRLLPVLFGTILCASPFFLTKHLGKIGALVSALALAITPASLFYSRYAIHEIMLICFVTYGGIFLYLYFFTENGKLKTLYILLSAFFFANAASTKETVAIHVLGISIGLILAFFAAQDGSWKILKNKRHLSSVSFFLVVSLVTMLLWYGPASFLDFIKSYFFYADLTGARHEKDWHYFFKLLWRAEWFLLLCGGAGLIFSFFNRRSIDLFFAGWLLTVFTIHSFIRYKTPWLILSFTTPLAFLLGSFVDHGLHGQWKGMFKKSALAVFSVLFFLAFVQSMNFNFRYFTEEKNPYMYVHTYTSGQELAERIKFFLQKNKEIRASFLTPDYWPMPFLLSPYKNQCLYWGKIHLPLSDSLLIANSQQNSEVEKNFQRQNYRKETYKLRPGVTLDLFVDEKLFP